MNITLVTPLFPPDTAASGKYIKELASKLSPNDVSLLLLGKLPESVPQVRQICVQKQHGVVVKTFKLFFNLRREAKDSDAILLLNGSSVELPVYLFSLISKKPIFFLENDSIACQWTKDSKLKSFINKKLKKNCKHVFSFAETTWPHPKPIIHPLKSYPEEKIKAYDESWHEHLEKLNAVISNHD
jgi:hypothetical protein